MTPERIAELRRLHEAATPGPWDATYVKWAVRHIARNCLEIEGDDPDFMWDRYDDAPLITAAANALPDLLDEVERLRYELTLGEPGRLRGIASSAQYDAKYLRDRVADLEAERDAIRSVAARLLDGYYLMRFTDRVEWWHPSEPDDGHHDEVTAAQRAVVEAIQAKGGDR